METGKTIATAIIQNQPLHLNLNVRGLKPSATVSINEHCDELRRAGKHVFKLGLGQSPFPVPDPVVAALRQHADKKTYLAVTGLRELREAVASYQFRTQRIEGDADDVLIGPGSKELMFLLQLVYYGEIVIPTPAWVSYAPQAHIIGRKVEWLETRAADGWRITPEQLERAWSADPTRPRILVLNYPNNPTSSTYGHDELRAIADVARRYRVVVLSDEIYGELHYEGLHVSIARFYPEGTIVSSGLSKWCGAGGWRLGTFFFPRELRWLLDAMAAVASETYTSTSAPIQYAAICAFQGGMELERYLGNVRRILAALAHWCYARLRAANITVQSPEGGFYLFADFGAFASGLAKQRIDRSSVMCARLLEDTGVAVLPGADFERDPEELTARLALVDFDGAKALVAISAMPPDAPIDERFLQSYCDPVLDAVNRIADWVEGIGR